MEQQPCLLWPQHRIQFRQILSIRGNIDPDTAVGVSSHITIVIIPTSSNITGVIEPLRLNASRHVKYALAFARLFPISPLSGLCTVLRLVFVGGLAWVRSSCSFLSHLSAIYAWSADHSSPGHLPCKWLTGSSQAAPHTGKLGQHNAKVKVKYFCFSKIKNVFLRSTILVLSTMFSTGPPYFHKTLPCSVDISLSHY